MWLLHIYQRNIFVGKDNFVHGWGNQGAAPDVHCYPRCYRKHYPNASFDSVICLLLGLTPGQNIVRWDWGTKTTVKCYTGWLHIFQKKLIMFILFLGSQIRWFDISLTYLGHCDLERSPMHQSKTMAARWSVYSLDSRIYISNNRVSVAKSSCYRLLLRSWIYQ